MGINPNNHKILNRLFNDHLIDINRSKIFDTPPNQMPKDFNFDRIDGMMLGLAIGDALGITTEGMKARERRNAYGEIRDYIPNRYVNKSIGFPSDDTQLSFWTLEQMIDDDGFVAENVAKQFCSGRIYGIGSTVRRFIYNYKKKIPWYMCGPKSAGNGALMRIAPMVIPHLKTGTSDLWVDTALSAMLTHNDSASISACISFINILWNILQMKSIPDPLWWLETYVDISKELEIDERYSPRGGAFKEYRGYVWNFVWENVKPAYKNNLSVLEACNSWYSGAYLLETIPSVLFILMKHGDNLEEAIIRAVNDTKDNDTIAAIVGAAVGALHGKKSIPDRWLENLSGRTRQNDDGKVFELLKKSREVF